MPEPSDPKTIAVTGANGWIGSWLCNIARNRGILIKRIDRTLLDSPANCHAQMHGCTSLIHLAGLAHEAGRNADENTFIQANVALTRTLAEAAAHSSIRRFVFVSSAKVLGSFTSAPADERVQALPEDAYGRSKLEAEKLLLASELPRPFESVSIRPPLVYGPGVRHNFRALIELANSPWPLPLAGATALRSLVYLDNLVDALLFLATRDQETRGCFHVSDGHDVSVSQLVSAMRSRLDRPRRLFSVAPDLMRGLTGLAGLFHKGPSKVYERLFLPLQLDSGALRTLGWEPAIDFDAALDATIRWYLKR
jgi:nucleoside-diphosphate-sugar epimerase